MKKILLVIALCFAFPAVGKSDTCWGTTVTGKNGHTYCVSTQEMNWYAALGWCNAQGRHLANLSEACDYNGLSYGTNSDHCPNLNDLNNSMSAVTVWVANSCIGGHGLSSNVVYVSSSGGGVACTINGGRFAIAAYHPHAMCY